jgi:phosphoribosyl 1,2-cyclic phosphodiesterase
LRCAVLGSGSEGNSILVSENGTSILIDAGFSGKKLEQRMNLLGETLGDLSALIVTHEHMDHIRGAGIVARRYSKPLYATRGTLSGGKSILGRVAQPVTIIGGEAFDIGDLRVYPFDISHDASELTGFVIESSSGKVGICTDSGCVTLLMREKLKKCDALVLEMNHDPTMLLAGPYPWQLKQRIRSRLGHLSNDDAGAFLVDLWHRNLKHVFLAHLSKENNLPQLARLSAEDALRKAGCGNGDTKLHVTSQETPTELVTF